MMRAARLLLFAPPLTKLAHSPAGCALPSFEKARSFHEREVVEHRGPCRRCWLLVGLNSCGRDQQLVSIQVQPSVENFGASTIPVIDNAARLCN